MEPVFVVVADRGAGSHSGGGGGGSVRALPLRNTKRQDQFHKQQGQGLNSNADICKEAADHKFHNTRGFSGDFVVGQQRQQIPELQFDKFPDPNRP